MLTPHERFYDLLEVSPDVTPRGLEVTWARISERLERQSGLGNKEAQKRLADCKLAWETLSDPRKRRIYDRWGEAGPPPGTPDDEILAPERMEVEEPKEDTAGFRGEDDGTAQARIVDGVLEVRIPFRLACKGGKADVAIKGHHHPVPVEPGTVEGDRAEFNGVNVLFRVAPDRVFRREGRDLFVGLRIEATHAHNGVEATIPTLDGPVKLKIPKGVKTGGKLRLRGKGVPIPESPGDLLVEIEVLAPDTGRVRGVGFRSG